MQHDEKDHLPITMLMQRKLDEMIDKLKATEADQKKASKGGYWSFWKEAKNPDLELMERLSAGLNLDSVMAVSELVAAIKLLENLVLNTKPPKTFKEYIKSKRERPTLDETNEVLQVPQNFIVTFAETKAHQENSKKETINKKTFTKVNANHQDLITLLTDLHTNLLACYAKDIRILQGKSATEIHEYTQEMIKASPALSQIEADSRQAALSDAHVFIADMSRGSTLQGISYDLSHIDEKHDIEKRFIEQMRSKIPGYEQEGAKKDRETEKNELLIQKLEEFSGGSITDPHSKAYRLYHFGGQNISGSLLQLFKENTKAEVNGKVIENLAGGSSKGNADWSKVWNKELGEEEIIGTINIKIFNFNEGKNDKEDLDIEPSQSQYVMSVDGLTLLELNNPSKVSTPGEIKQEIQYEKGILLGNREKSQLTKNEALPIAEVSATIKLVLDEKINQYVMQVTSASTKYYSNSLTFKPYIQLEAKAEDTNVPPQPPSRKM